MKAFVLGAAPSAAIYDVEFDPTSPMTLRKRHDGAVIALVLPGVSTDAVRLVRRTRYHGRVEYEPWIILRAGDLRPIVVKGAEGTPAMYDPVLWERAILSGALLPHLPSPKHDWGPLLRRLALPLLVLAGVAVAAAAVITRLG